MTRYALPALLLTLAACAAERTQTIEGRVSRAGFSGTVLGARVVAGDRVVNTNPVESDGSFTLEVPVGTGYRIEIITSDGAQPMVGQTSGTVVHFDVCAPVDPYDVGDVYQGDAWPGCDDPNNDGTCEDPDDPPPECDPQTGENCCENPQPDGTCGGGEDPECDPTTDPNCPPDDGGGCDPQTGEGCCTPNGDGTCTPCDPSDPTCGCTDDDGDGLCDGEDPGPGCVPADPNCCANPLPDGTCGDPTCTDADGNNLCDCDPNTGEYCGDPGCTDDDGDGLCDGGGVPGCPDPNADGSCDCPENDPTLCWPPPGDEPCTNDDDGVCDPGDAAIPEQIIPDFGCDGA